MFIQIPSTGAIYRGHELLRTSVPISLGSCAAGTAGTC